MTPSYSVTAGLTTKTSPSAKSNTRNHLNSLTVLRFVAALMVVLFHVVVLGAGTRQTGLNLVSLGINVLNCGYLGVSFFFILSGFILTYTYLGDRPLTRQRRTKFWVARIARIYPVYVVALALAAYTFLPPFAARTGTARWAYPTASLLASLGLVQSWLPTFAFAWVNPGWSLSTEAFFYLLFPFIGNLLYRLNIRNLLIAVAVVWVAFILPVLGYSILHPDGVVASGMPDSSKVFWLGVLYTNPLLRLPEFLIGIALGRMYILHTTHEEFQNANPRRLCGGVLLALAGIAVIVLLGPLTPMEWSAVLIDPFFALLIYCAAMSHGRLERLSSVPLVRLLGEASYALYLIHYQLWQMTKPVLDGLHLSAVAYSGTVILFVLCTIGLAMLIFEFIEEPARVRIRTSFDSWQARHLAPARTI